MLKLPEIGLERPANPDHGDCASNAAMQLAPVARAAPMRIAERLVEHFVPRRRSPRWRWPRLASSTCASIPGWVAARSGRSARRDRPTVRTTLAEPPSINVEFVSANPTGPLTVGNARGAFVGDVLSRVLEAAGHSVTREYYFNDFNEQIRNLGLTLLAVRERGEPSPAGRVPRRLRCRAGGGACRTSSGPRPPHPTPIPASSSAAGRRSAFAPEIEASLERLGVHFDVWTSEGAIHEAGWVERAIERLREQPGTCTPTTARSGSGATSFGDDKDRVVIRSNGRPTYFAADIGYVAEKFSRGFDELIYIWGADHHGTVARNRAAAIALGFDPDAVRWPLIAWVRFVRDGKSRSR